MPGFEVISWSGFAAPAGTPQPIIDRLHAEVQRAIAVPSVKERLQTLGGDVRGTTPEEMRALVSRQVGDVSQAAQGGEYPAAIGGLQQSCHAPRRRSIQ